MHLAASTALLQQPTKHLCLPRPSFAQPLPTQTAASSSQQPVDDIEQSHTQQQETDKGCQPLLKETIESYSVFSQCSVNLITCSSNSGKTRFLHQVVHHRHHFFQNPQLIQRIVYVNGNQRDFSFKHPWVEDPNSSNLDIVSLALEDFNDFATVLQSNDLLILDDILQLDESIQFIVKYGAHHYQLASVFVVTQSCLSSPLYSLIRSVHNLVLLFGNTATTRLAQHLVQTFFLCTETKAYLKAIFGLAEKYQDIVVLKLNAVASYRPHSQILALGQVQKLFVENQSSSIQPVPYCLVYPELSHIESMEKKSSLTAQVPEGTFGRSASSNHGADATHRDQHLQEAFVLLPMSRVRSLPTETQESDLSKADCIQNKQQQWNEMAAFLESEIESAFAFKKWNAAKNLAREMLRCNELCISADFRSVFLKNKPRHTYSIIDFLMAATRKAGPGETSEKVAMYRPLVLTLLRHQVPHSFIVNKLLLPSSHGGVRESRYVSTVPRTKRLQHEYFDDY